MTEVASTAGRDVTVLPAADHTRQSRRAAIGSVVGSAIEWYDFILYSIAAGLVFPKVFFPESDPFTALINSYGIFAVGFLARPAGAIIFGHLGDRLGRKGTLVGTLILMGIGTFFVAFVPGHETIGIWGAVILVLLRFVQGVGVGGEWAGAVLVSMEWSKPRSRGLSASWPQIGVPLGLVLANLVFALASYHSGDAFLDRGWRVPFLLSGGLVLIGLYLRFALDETPVFRKMEEEKRIEKAPVVQAVRKTWRKILTVAFLRMAEMSMFQIMTVFVYTYCTQVLGFERSFVLTAVMTAAILQAVSIPVFGAMSDRVGRKRIFRAGAVAAMLFGFIYFTVLGAGHPSAVFVIIALSLIPHAMMYGSEAALVTENFSSELRYSGSSLGYQLASLIGGGPTPFITASLFHFDQSGYAIAAYLGATCLVSLTALSFLRETRGSAD
jgi:MFS family permease